MSAVIIEVALNGITRKDRNPAAPETPEEIAADAVACLEAGAAIIHTHATSTYRDPASSEPLAEEYAQAFRQILAERPDALVYPTMSGGETIQQRWGHHEILAEEGVISAAVVDPGSVNLAGTGEDGLPRPDDFVYVNSPKDILYMMARCDALGIGPNMAIFEPGFFRVPLAYYRAGKLPAGSFTKFYFSGDVGYLPGSTGPLFSCPPLPESLEMYLAMKGDATLPWAVSVITGSLLDTEIAAMAIERGGHIRIGLEDNSSAESNVAEVNRAVALIEHLGHHPATTEETKQLLDLPAS